jgi:predicted nucleotidyltransferase
MSVTSYLSDLSMEAIPTQAEKDSISTSIITLCNRIEAEFGYAVVKQFRFGSSLRGTMLPRTFDDRSDIDFMVVFRDNDKSPQTYLDRLKRFSERRYSSSDIKQSSPSIVLELNHIKFDLVPAITYFSTYQIPAPQSAYQTWIQTDPVSFNASLTQKNGDHNHLIKPVIRLAKMWNVQAGRVFDSYALELAIVNTPFYLLERSVKSYFYHAMLSLSLPWNEAQWRKDGLERAKDIVNSTKALESGWQADRAEREVAKLF